MSLAEAAGAAEKKETQMNEGSNNFRYCVLIIFGFLRALCGLERSGREKIFHLSLGQQGAHRTTKSLSRGYKERFFR
jgi:hypothetical protein